MIERWRVIQAGFRAWPRAHDGYAGGSHLTADRLSLALVEGLELFVSLIGQRVDLLADRLSLEV